MNFVKLDKASHTYTKGDKTYFSITKFIALFHKHFEDDKVYWLNYKAIQYLSKIDNSKINKYSQDLQDEIGPKIFSPKKYAQVRDQLGTVLKKPQYFRMLFSHEELELIDVAMVKIDKHWKKVNLTSTTKGTAIHEIEENQIIDSGEYIYEGVRFPSHNLEGYDLNNLPEGAIAELIIHNEFTGLCGTADLILVYPGKKVRILDNKTNAKLDKTNRYQNMLYPIAHMPDCNMAHYTLQLSMYGWMLQQYGYEVLGLEIIHITEFTREVFKLDYHEMEVNAMVNHYLKHLKDAM